jgi:hypothetical protein
VSPKEVQFQPQFEAPPIEPAQEPQQEADDPRDMTVFKPFLRSVGGEDRAWGDTVSLTEMLNELRAEVGEPSVRHADVLRSVRKAMGKLGETHRRNFASIS